MGYTGFMSRQYITTAIDYANAAPHMGHVMEKIMADVLARWFRLRGDETRFQIGMDEHGIKIQQTALKQGMTPQELVEKTVPLYQSLYKRLAISADVFIRTTDQERHWPTVVALWQRLEQAGALEKRSYAGLYCPGCERFLAKRDLVNGLCPLHNSAPQEVKEENWFFALSRETAWLKELLTKESGYHIVPASRAPETMSLVEQGLEDVSFSRPQSSLSWGIPVPDDPDQVMYVWCDALTNYVSGLGLLTDHVDSSFWDDAEVTHVIGKDIARFHALIWPAMLKHAGLRTPDRLLIHGFVTSEGQKMSKTIGNIVDPEEVLALFSGNPDPLRFFLTHEIPVGNDGDFSWKRLEELYDAMLRNKLGNLLNRVLVLLGKLDTTVTIPDEAHFIVQSEDAALVWDRYAKHMDALDAWSAVHFVFDWLVDCDKYITVQEPWKMADSNDRRLVLSILAENLRHISLMLLPFIPDTAYRISKQLNVPYAEEMRSKEFVITDALKQWGGCKEWKTVGEPEILFKPLI